MTIRERVAEGKSVRVAQLADETGMPQSTIYNLVKTGRIEAIRIGRGIVITARAARPLLGMDAASEAKAAA